VKYFTAKLTRPIYYLLNRKFSLVQSNKFYL
jgi:hypothetical protein